MWIEVIKRLNRKGWHGYGCAVHPREAPRNPYFGHDDDEPIMLPGGRCDCGADELVAKVNKYLEDTKPGQLELPF